MSFENPLKIATKDCKCDELSDEQKFKRLDEIIELYRDQNGNLINVLYVAQAIFGYLPPEVIKHVAKTLDLPTVRVDGVATFYSFFSKFPKGKYTIKVCLGTACYVRGGKGLLEKMKKDLNISVGETTSDGMFSLDVVRCVGACALAPVVVVNNDTHRRVKESKVNEILNPYRKEAGSTKKAKSEKGGK